ncbi:MAG: hypothetical protein ACI4SQ_05105 [Eubacterium sp.]
MAIILIALGLMITGIDKWYVLDVAYPAFHVRGMIGSHEPSPSIQLYTTGNILGNHVKIDLLPDALGCIFLLIGAFLLVKRNKEFILGILMTFVAMALNVLLPLTGFIEQGPKLVIWILVVYFGYAVAELVMEYVLLYCTVGVTDDLANRATNTRILFCWWITAIARVYMTFLTFVGHGGVNRVYKIIMSAFVLFYGISLITTKKYVGLSPVVSIRQRRQRDKKEKL